MDLMRERVVPFRAKMAELTQNGRFERNRAAIATQHSDEIKKLMSMLKFVVA